MKLEAADLGQINADSDRPKFLQISDRVRELIDAGTLRLGDRLPSVNQVITHFGVSRDTAVRAYQTLKDRGIIETTPNLACFVSNTYVREDLKRVLFLVDSLTPYKERIYHGLLDHLPEGFYVDVLAHSDDFDLLRRIYERYKKSDDCAAILIVPTAGQLHDLEYFRFVNRGNLLFLDRPVHGSGHPSVHQEFNRGFQKALESQKKRLEKYSRLVFMTKYFSNPIIEEMKEGLARFAADTGKTFHHTHTLFTDRDIAGTVKPLPGDLLIILDDHILLETLTECGKTGLLPGRDVGIAVINEGPFYSRLPLPISVLSADFYTMGKAAARFVNGETVSDEPVQTTLKVTESL